jgi:maltooligosyltrehalose trehalohydrolase
VLNHELRKSGQHAVLYRLHHALLQLRARWLPFSAPDEVMAFEAHRLVWVRRGQAWMAFCFSARAREVALPVPPGKWHLRLSSADLEWNGPGTTLAACIESTGEVSALLQPHSFICYTAEPHE